MPIEFWKPVVGYEGLYEISSFGRVKSLPKYVNASHRGFVGKRLLPEKIMKPSNCFGYLIVALRKDGKYKKIRVHRLVAQAFIPNPENLPCVNHKDENTLNNKIENLEWCTHEYNDNYGSRNEKISKSRKGLVFTDEHRRKLSESHKAIVTDEFREKMRLVHKGTKLSEEHKKRIGDGVRKAHQKSIN